MVTYTDVMIDLETTHTLPDRGAILQIAAVKFNRDTFDICPQVFDRCLTVPKHRAWDEGTRSWWLNQKESTLSDILHRAKPWLEVINQFADWAYPAGHLRFWSKPSHFDFNFLSSYFHDAELANPFHFREATDMNSFIRGLYFPNNVPNVNIPFEGAVHNALDDTFHQLAVLFHHLQEAKKLTKQEIFLPEAELNTVSMKLIEGE